ncbi:inorganic pyrophosphatase [Candidatus Bipolaricaulota bacterium]
MDSIFNDRFWKALDTLVQMNPVVIDRPAGSQHPRYPEFVYPFDYGYLAGTTAIDGGGIDVWVGSLGSRAVTGAVFTVDVHKNDAEVKILIGCTGDEMTAIETYHNAQSQSGILAVRKS